MPTAFPHADAQDRRLLPGRCLAGLNQADNLGRDYPLIRRKYALLLLIAPVFLAEAVRAGPVLSSTWIPTSSPPAAAACSPIAAAGVAAELAGLPPRPAMLAFFAVLALTVAAGLLRLWRSGRGGYLFGALSVAQFVVAISAVIAFLSLYVYEHPHHHCPFCLLKAEFGYIGYPLYGTLFAATGYALAAALQQAHATIPAWPACCRRGPADMPACPWRSCSPSACSRAGSC
jgi:hypothetical protein